MDFKKTKTSRVCCPQDWPISVKGKKIKETCFLHRMVPRDWRMSSFQVSLPVSMSQGKECEGIIKELATFLFPVPYFLKLVWTMVWPGTQITPLSISHLPLPSHSCHFQADTIIESLIRLSLWDLVLVFFTFYLHHNLFWCCSKNLSEIRVKSVYCMWFWASTL